jgi:hypothetical protein
MSVFQTIVSYVMVTDIKHNYGISCRLTSVCFGLRNLSVLDILLYSRYSKVIYMPGEKCQVIDIASFL